MQVKVRKFKLSEQFLETYRDKEVPWGSVGYITYKRTYARRLDEFEEGAQGTEEWWQTCRRVIEGMITMQKQHITELGIEWNDAKAQKTAKDAYDRLFNLKWTPPGRGLWMMGTDFVENKTGAGLFNCSFRSTKDYAIKGGAIFAWIMDALMLGIGVGFDTLGKETFVVKAPGSTQSKVITQSNFVNLYKQDKETLGVTCVIADSREGWVESIHVLLDAFVFGNGLPTFDYSLIREKGAIIRGFGGVSSGYGPLEELHQDLIKLYSERIGEKIRSVDIVDTENLIGRCVVAGNIRRSAALSLGSFDDKEYMTMKNDQEKLYHHRWGSNNSFHAIVGQDYSWHAKQSQVNGEPGYIWLDNARTYGRMKDPQRFDDTKVMGFNPCFAGDTLIAVADGRGAVPIEQLALEGKDVPVYSMNPENGEVEIKMGRNPRITGENQKLLEIVLDDNSTLRVTPNHKFYLRDGTKVEAKDLKFGDSLPRLSKWLESISTKSPNNKYLRLQTSTRSVDYSANFEHRIIALFNQQEEWDKMSAENKKIKWLNGGLVIHHKDYNKLNNAPDNLQIMTRTAHAKLHAGDNVGEKNGMFGKKHNDVTLKEIGKSSKARWKDPEFQKKQEETWTEKRREGASKVLSDIRTRMNKEYYLEQEAITDLQTVWEGDVMYAKKNCEVCNKEFVVSWAVRGQATCSKSCGNKSGDGIAARKEGQKVAFSEKQKKTLDSQIQVYKNLELKLKRPPMKKEWEVSCKENEVSYRIRVGDSFENPYVLTSFKQLQDLASKYNHKVLEVREVEGTATVYNISVDDYHTVGIATSFNKETLEISGVYTAQCSEQQLESEELCCLTETFPALHDSYEDYLKTLKIAYLYAKTVTLAKTQWPGTNGIMLKNRRIGLSMSGVIQAFNKFSKREVLKWCDNAYTYVQDLDMKYSDWLCIPRSKRTTSIKPSGTVSLLNGSTPGIHFPEDEYYIRRIRFSAENELLPELIKAGYPIEDCKYSPDTKVVSFPVQEPYFVRGKRQVSMWEQLEVAAAMQHYWADNSVSVTVTFKGDEGDQIKDALELYESRLKAVSFLKYEETGYVQAPYEPISAELYWELSGKITPIQKFSNNDNAGLGTKFCDGDSCVFDWKKPDEDEEA